MSVKIQIIVVYTSCIQTLQMHIVSPSARVDMPQVPFQKLSQNSGLHLSQLFVPLFTEDRYSTSTDNNQDNCDVEISTIARRQIPSQVTTMVMSPQRPVSTLFTVDYSTQGDPNQIAPQGNYEYNQSSSTMPIQNTNNYFIPDGSNRCIHHIWDKTLHIGILENGHNAYLVELTATRCAFGCMGPTGPTPTTQTSQPCLVDPVSTAYNKDIIPDLTTQKPPPRTVPNQPPSFNLHRPTKCLTKEETLEVHHNYISAVSNLERKKDLINRLKQSEPHNNPTYKAEMTHHMALHNDVVGRIHTILKQDDHFRTLEELLVIDGLHAYAYDDIQLFPELFDTPAVIERITSKADLIEKQLNRSGMYPLLQPPLLCTSGFIPRPSSTFQPITPAAPSPATKTAKPHQTQQSQEPSPGSSLPCGEGTPTATSDSQPQVQPGSSTTSQGIPTKNSPAHSQFMLEGVTPQTSPIRTQNYSLSQNSIPAPEATVPNTPEEKIPKSLNRKRVKNSRKQATTPQLIPKTVDSALDVNSWVT